MPKGSYIPWTASEENNLEQWISEHLWLSWERRAEEYSKQHNKGRSFESLRGKYNQLRKGIRRRRPISDKLPTRIRTMTRRARYRRQKLPEGFPPCPPVHKLKASDPWARRLLQQGQQFGNARPRASVASLKKDNYEPSYPAHHAAPAPNRSFGGVNNQPLFHSFGG
ncbi:hypothetical protein N7537_010492 [Penicillium hordei]|uniref:Myb-like domain-containing protein n=1 Tax=Penicillium hordei TaxID=40994 RepID=A0AAD6DV40_9EURO|nr:uncharacterized protein N7537_010492 [Penicillium hordei]KAJ5593588.1 hypothetical protein N7537_010492 [Penicillium hordei]